MPPAKASPLHTMNLINNARNTGTIGSKGLIKIGILAAIGILSAVGFSWFLRIFLLGGDWMQLLWALLCALAFLVIFILQTFFIRSNIHFGLVFLLQSFALIGFFFNATLPITIMFVVIYAMLYSTSYTGRKILDNTLKVDFWNISKLVAPKGIIVVTLLVSVFVPLHLQTSGDGIPLSAAAFDAILRSGNVFMQRFYPGIDTTKSLEQFARTATEQQLNVIPGANALPANAKEQLVRKGMQDVYKQVFSATGVQVNPKDPLSKSAYAVLQKKFNGLQDATKTWIFVLAGSLIFISIASIIWPIRILVSLIAYVVYESMIALGFIRLTIEERPKEILLLD